MTTPAKNMSNNTNTPGNCRRGVLPFDDCSGVGCPSGGCKDGFCERQSCNTSHAQADRGDIATVPPANISSGIVDRRSGIDRRDFAVDDASGLERRRGPGRRLSDFNRSAEEGNLTKEQFLFVMAIESFKKANGKAFPTWTDVLEVIRLLGYRKTMPMEINLSSAEDWQESYSNPSNVRPPRWAEHKHKPGTKRDAA